MRKIHLLVSFGFCLLLSLLTACSGSNDAPIQNNAEYQLLIEPAAGVEPVLQAINQAKTEIDVVMYLFTDKRVAKALMQAAQRGVMVKALIEKTPYEAPDANQWLESFWKGTHVQWHWVPVANSTLNFYHEKTMLIDHHQAWVMTLNFVYSSFSDRWTERNFAVIDNNAQDVAAIDKIFQQDWQDKAVSQVENDHLVVSPINTRSQLEMLVASAHLHLKVYADQLSDYQLIGKLAKAAKHGVEVQIIYGGTLRENAQSYLQKNGVHLHQASSIKNHAKVIIVDDQKAYVGSANFTENSFLNNREVGLILADQGLIKRLTTQFDQDWQG